MSSASRPKSPKRTNTVPTRAVFLGAGASKAFGYPLTSEILPRIKDKLEKKTLFAGDWSTDERKVEEEKQPERLREYLTSHLCALLPGWKLDDIQLPLITEILSLVDYSLLSSTAPAAAKGSVHLAECRKLIERAIYEIIDDAHRGKAFPIRDKFIDWILRDHEHTGLITTNYDVEIDEGIFKRYPNQVEDGFDFGFAWRVPDNNRDLIVPRPSAPLFRLYKLHGSVNWLRCDLCEHTYINLDGPIGDRAFDTDPIPENSCWCGHHMLSLVLVAPSFVREVRNPDLLHTWKNSLELLRRAREWYIIGYSFPPEDLAIRAMFLRAFNGRWDSRKRKSGPEIPPRVTVVQKENRKEQQAAIQSRYRSLFPDCKFFWDGLEDFVKSL